MTASPRFVRPAAGGRAVPRAAVVPSAVGALVAALLAVLLMVAPPARAWTVPAAGSSVAVTGQYLPTGAVLRSPDGRFQLVQQRDGNLVLSAPEGPLWSTGTHGAGNATWVQADGNVVVRSTAGTALWSTRTASTGPVKLALQSDGNLVLYAGSQPLWQSNTSRTATPPFGYGGTATQVITVVAARAGATTAVLTGWTRTPSGWTRTVAATTAFVGAAGVGAASEGSTRTPAGTFTLTQSFGRVANPGTRLPWFTTDTLDWWDENPASPTYNLHVRRATSPGGASENLYRTGTAYDAAVVIDYNTARTPGAGSGFFLHVSTGVPTAGCVSVPAATVVAILRWLNPAAHPVITIGVG